MIRNAEIQKTFLGFEGHGQFTFTLTLDYGGSVQGFGSFALASKGKGSAWGCEAIMQVLKTVGVSKWEDLPGKHVRVKGDRTHIEAIGHFLEDKWLNLNELEVEECSENTLPL